MADGAETQPTIPLSSGGAPLRMDETAAPARSAEQLLRESEARFRQIADHLPNGFIYQAIEDTAGRARFSYASAGVETLLGVSPAAILADPLALYGRIEPDDLLRVRAAEEAAARSRTPFDCCFRSRAGTGAVRWLHCRSACRPLPGGGYVWDGIALDVTERMQAEAESHAHEEQFRTLADSVPQLAWMARADGHIFWYNRRWYEYTGTTLADMDGWGWQAVHDPAELPRVLEGWRAALARATPWEDTFPLRRHDGVLRWHLSRAVPVKDERGRVVRWFGTNTDITERKEMEEALRAADRRKDEFLAILAHELRNPLAPIRNAVQVMKMMIEPGAELAWTVDVIDRQAQQMSRLVDDLLDVSRIASGKFRLNRERVPLAAVLERAAETARPLIDSRGHHLSVTLPAEPIYLEADPLRLSQVVGNLLANAAKYTDAGGAITLTATIEDAQAVVRVRDTGIGIAPEMLSRVFDVFTQADRAVARSDGGLGLGLTLVKRLVELHGGAVAAHSAGLGHGSEFTLRLPLT